MNNTTPGSSEEIKHTNLKRCMHPFWRRKWQSTPVFLPQESQGRGAWWAAVYGVAQSQTQLNRLSSTMQPYVHRSIIYNSQDMETP